MDKFRKKLMAWLLDVIETEVAKPDGEADMELVEECTLFLEEMSKDEPGE